MIIKAIITNQNHCLSRTQKSKPAVNTRRNKKRSEQQTDEQRDNRLASKEGRTIYTHVG